MRKILLILVLCMATTEVFGATTADQDVAGTLGSCFTINNTVVNGVDYACGGTATMNIESVTPVSPTVNQLALTPIDVNVETNDPGSYQVDGTFDSLAGPTYTFPPSALSLVPSTETDTIPVAGTQLFGPYEPQVLVNTDVVAGTYNGVITFTVAKL